MTLPGTEWEMGHEGQWAPMDTRTSPDATGGALNIVGLRRDAGRLRPIEAPSLLATDGAADTRRIFYHRRGDTQPAIRLTVAGTKLYADGVEQKLWDGTALSLSPVGSVTMDQGSNQTLVLDGGAASPAYLFDETLTAPNRVVALTIPATPGGMTTAVADVSGSRLDTGDGSLTQAAGALPAGWTVTDATTFPGNFATGAFSTATFHIDTSSPPGVVGERITYDMGAGQDWSVYNSLTLVGKSAGSENKTGYLLDFIFSADGVTWQRLPISFATARTELPIVLELSNIASADRSAVRYWGFERVEGDEFVVNFASLSYATGTVGPREYVRTRHLEVGSGDNLLDLQSLEGPLDADGNATVSVDAGTKGAQVTLTFTDGAVPGGYVDKIWRRDTGAVAAAKFHYLGDAAAGSTTYVDATFDVSENVTLKQGRAAPITGATCGAFSRSRLHLYKEGKDRISAVGQPVTFSDSRPEDVPQLQALGLIGPGDALTVNMGEIGNVLVMAKFGIDLADEYTSSLLLMTADGLDALFQGDAPEDMNIHRQQPGGVCGPHAWCRDKHGNIVSVDPDGDVVVRDRTLASPEKPVSYPIQDDLRNAGGKSAWVMARDGLYNRLVLFADVPRVFDGDGWSTLDPATVGTVTCAATAPTSDGGQAVAGGLLGKVTRLFDPAAPKTAGLYETAEWNHLPQEWRAERMWGDAEGAVTADLLADGATVATFRFTAREMPVKIHKARRFKVRVNVGADGVAHRVTTRLVPWRT
jgi:hypothetical protein